MREVIDLLSSDPYEEEDVSMQNQSNSALLVSREDTLTPGSSVEAEPYLYDFEKLFSIKGISS